MDFSCKYLEDIFDLTNVIIFYQKNFSTSVFSTNFSLKLNKIYLICKSVFYPIIHTFISHTCLYLFNSSATSRMRQKVTFLSELKLVWIWSFLFPRLVCLTKDKESNLLNYLPKAGDGKKENNSTFSGGHYREVKCEQSRPGFKFGSPIPSLTSITVALRACLWISLRVASRMKDLPHRCGKNCHATWHIDYFLHPITLAPFKKNFLIFCPGISFQNYKREIEIDRERERGISLPARMIILLS